MANKHENDDSKDRQTHAEKLQRLASRTLDAQAFMDQIVLGAHFDALTDGLRGSSSEEILYQRLIDRLALMQEDLNSKQISETMRANLEKRFGNIRAAAADLFIEHVFGEVRLSAESLMALYEQDLLIRQPGVLSEGSADDILQRCVGQSWQEELDPLVLLVLARPDEYMDSLSRVWRVLSELHAVADDPLDDESKLLRALRHGLRRRSDLPEVHAPPELLRQIESVVASLFDRLPPDTESYFRGSSVESKIKINAQALRLTSNPHDASMYIYLEKPPSHFKRPDWKYHITYAVGDGLLTRHILISGDDQLVGEIKSFNDKDWQSLSYGEAFDVLADLEDVYDALHNDFGLPFECYRAPY